MAYNTLKVWSAYEVLGSSDLNSNMANLDFLKTQVWIQMSQGRLTLETGVAISTSDQTAKTTLYFTPFRGNKIGLYDSGASTWDLYTFTEVSLSLSGHIKGALYDIFGYLSGGSLALESLVWKKVAATNNPSAGSSVVINISDTGDLAVGREVTVKDGSNSEIATITAVSTNVSITVGTLANSYTTPDIYGFNTRETGLTLNNGIWIKSGDTTRRYLGTIRITDTAGQCEDSTSKRFVWNMHNRVERRLKAVSATSSWVYVGVWREANGGSTYGSSRVGVVVGINEDLVDLTVLVGVLNASLNNGNNVGVGLDSSVTNSATVYSQTVHGSVSSPSVALYKGFVGIGFHSLRWIEIGSGSSCTFYGTYSGMSGLFGHVMA